MAGRSKPVFGVGIKGSLPSCVNGKKVKSYMFWCNMLQRCYSDKYQNGQPTYIGCTVCDEWTNYANFKSWFDRNYINGYHLDKDILKQGNAVYGPDFCAFIPKEINNLILDRSACRGDLPIGVCFHSQTGKYSARVNINGRQKRFGLYNSPLEASSAYIKEKSKHIRDKALDYYNNGLIPKNIQVALNSWQVGELSSH